MQARPASALAPIQASTISKVSARRRIEMSPADVEAMVAYQIGALQALARAAGTRVSHVKPHGALANMASEREDYATAIAKAILAVDDTLIFVVLAGSAQHDAAIAASLPLAREGYADRLYLDDGNLAPRACRTPCFTSPNAPLRRRCAWHSTARW